MSYETEAAIDQIARQVLTSAIDDEVIGEAWEDWPEVSERDWQAIVRRTGILAIRVAPQTEKLQGAYEYLAARADHEEAS